MTDLCQGIALLCSVQTRYSALTIKNPTSERSKIRIGFGFVNLRFILLGKMLRELFKVLLIHFLYHTISITMTVCLEKKNTQGRGKRQFLSGLIITCLSVLAFLR